jgi:tRNA (adenine22-N1)-methyltransferase
VNSPKISKRLLCAASFANKGELIADVGTDHAYLPIYLYTSGIISGAVVSDINEGPIERAAKNIREFSCEGKIIPVLCDGLSKIKEYSPDTVFILGMGGELIVNIISNAEWLKQNGIRLVMQPMTHPEILREYLISNGFEISDEAMVDDSKIYQIIVAKYTGIVSEADKLELRFGKINLNERKNILIRAMNREKQILGARLEGKRKAGLDGGEDLEIFNMIDTYLKQ